MKGLLSSDLDQARKRRQGRRRAPPPRDGRRRCSDDAWCRSGPVLVGSAGAQRGGLGILRLRHVKRLGSGESWWGVVGSCCRRGLPIGVRFGSEGPQRATGDQMRLNVEGVVDGGMGGQEALG